MLKNKIRSIKLDKKLDTYKRSFETTPVLSNDFKSVIVKIPATEFIFHSKRKLHLILSFFYWDISRYILCNLKRILYCK